ncbi:hypothetical protein D039_0714B, partial [Vibrio parahaemolyticus EKP-028]
RVVLEELG